MKFLSHHVFYLIKALFGAFTLVLLLSISEGGTSFAQEKNKFERLNEKKNKLNRRNKRRGDKARSNKRKLRATKFKSRTRQGEKAYRGDITGRKVVTKRSPRRSSAGYAQPNPYAGRRRKTEASVAKKVLSRPRYTARPSETAKRVSVNPRYSNKPRERAFGRRNRAGRAFNSVSGKFSFVGKSRYQGGSVRSATRRSEDKVSKGGRIIPRSASGAYRVRKRRSPYSSFRPRKKWEKAFKGDITGRTFRTKRTTEKPIIQKPPQTRYTNRGKRKGDSPYSGNVRIGGAFQSATKQPERAWKKDITGKKNVRVRTSQRPDFSGSQFSTYPMSKKRRGDKAYKGKLKGGGYKSKSSRKEVAGRSISQRTPPGRGTGRAVQFQGNIKAQKPLKGGGSISGRTWNNNGRAVTKQNNSIQSQRVRAFQGNIKATKPIKGGGSISGRRWNNNGKSVTKPNNTEQSQRVRSFQGNLKASKPLKGGGSVARNNWNNNGKATTKYNNSEQSQRIRSYQGNMKPQVRGRYDALAGFYKGNMKRKFAYRKNPNAAKESLKVKEAQKNDKQGANYTGNVRLRSAYKRNSNSVKEALKVREAQRNDKQADKYTGNIRLRYAYKKNPNSAKEALKVKEAQKNDIDAARYTGNIKGRVNYKKNPNAADEALRKRAPGKNEYRQANYQGTTKLAYRYQRKPHAADDALKGRGPLRAAIQASNYQGNIKMSKKRLEDRHPSLKYARGKNSSTAEKKKLFSVKILFAKLFKKNEGQPNNIKKKERAPRFDKREKDIWYE